jgi:hypothetical protein
MIYSEITIGDSNKPLLAFAIHNGNYLPRLREITAEYPRPEISEEDPLPLVCPVFCQ